MRDYNERQLHLRRVWLGLLVAVLLLTLFGSVLWILHQWEENTAPEEESFPTVSDDPWDDVETLLIIGIDKFDDMIDSSADGYRNNQQADFLLLLMVNRTTKQCHMLHINRDTMSKVPVLNITGEVMLERREQLALAHTYGSGKEDSCRNTVHAVSAFLHGVPIDHYVSVTMDAVQILNDAVDGVTVEVTDDFSNVDKTLVKGQTVTLRGSQALTYVRARYGVEDQTNLNRMARQRQYMTALQSRLIEKIHSDRGFTLNTLMDLSGHMISDCPVEHLSILADRVAEYGYSEILTPAGETRVGERNGEPVMEFIADDEALQSMIVDLFYTPSTSSDS